jgi:hypothetical protein
MIAFTLKGKIKQFFIYFGFNLPSNIQQCLDLKLIAFFFNLSLHYMFCPTRPSLRALKFDGGGGGVGVALALLRSVFMDSERFQIR